MINKEKMSKWAKEILRFISVKPQYVISGNIYDIYPLEIEEKVRTYKINDYIKTLLKNEGYTIIVTYEPLFGFELIYGEENIFKEITGLSLSKEKRAEAALTPAAEIIEMLTVSDKAYSAVIINYSSRLQELMPRDINEFYFRMFRMGQSSFPKVVDKTRPDILRHNLLFWIMDKENDIPAWYTIDNPKVKNLSVSKPDHTLRRFVIESLAQQISGFNDITEEKKSENISLFVDQTNALFAGEIISIIQLSRKEDLRFDEIGEAIRRYKLGIIENEWAKIDKNKLANADIIIGDKVKGQDSAVIKSIDIIKRAFYNLSGSQYSKYSQRPKGVLFFAGPTGVGKTELAKSITNLLFGSENSYIRFDMSEFAKEHSDQRLIGAPPGYVGYDVGGELTNAVKQNPFSVILFDEIEKANPKILDIFLQILDDGRLTSGRGETVYFSESLIIFTSNLGIYETLANGEKIQKINMNMNNEEIKKSIMASIDIFFKYKIQRPEILNRIGENIVIFDFIRKNIALEIFEKMLNNVFCKIKDDIDIDIIICENIKKQLEDYACENLEMGGRGIGNKIEDVLINPLARELFINKAVAGDKWKIVGVTLEESSWKLEIEKYI